MDHLPRMPFYADPASPPAALPTEAEIKSSQHIISLGRRHLLDSIFWTGKGAHQDPAINGPFNTESALNEALARKSMMNASDHGRHGYKTDFYRRSLPSIFRGHQPVFTHGDFQRKNIIVRKVIRAAPSASNKAHKGTDSVEDYEITLVDWEKAGWYPTYWEYCSATWSFRWDDDWPNRVENILQLYRIEFP